MKKTILPKLQMMFTGAAVSAFALLWWGVLYPELCFPKDTYEAVLETEGEQALSEEEIRYQLLHADEEQVIVKSRLFEWIKQKE